MNITKNIIKNCLFDFVVLEYNNKVKYGQPPTPIVFFYNNWLLSRLIERGYIEEEADTGKTREKYQDKFLDLTWQAVEDMVRDRIIKRRLLSADDLLHWDLYVPTEKGLEIWEKFGKLVIIPSNMVDSLRDEFPETSDDTEIVLDYLNEGVNCYFHNLQTACCLCIASAGERALFSFIDSFVKIVDDKYWLKLLENSSILKKIDLVKEKIRSLIKQEDLLKKYAVVYSTSSDEFKKDIESLLRSMDLIASIINLTRNDDGSPSLAVLNIEITYRQDLILGYLIGSYNFFNMTFTIKEILDNIIDYEGK